MFATNSGKRLMSAGDMEGALSQFHAALEAQPDYADAHYQLGQALRRKGNAEGAKREFQEALRLDPTLTMP